MEKIKLEEYKRLRLVNVLIKKLPDLNMEHLNEEVKKFINFLEMSQIQTRGPLITKMSGTKISDMGEISIDYEIMVQTIREVKPPGYLFQEEIVANNCLYAHFDGLEEEFSFVHSKMSVYIWENDLIETGEEYTIHLESLKSNFVADVFKPMEKTK